MVNERITREEERCRVVENSYRRENPPGRGTVDWGSLKRHSSRGENTRLNRNAKRSFEISGLKGTRGGGSGVRRLILKACY